MSNLLLKFKSRDSSYGVTRETLKALADENRLRAVCALRGGELCVCELVAALRMPQGKVSRHLAVLKQAGLVRHRREGAWVEYHDPHAPSFISLLGKTIKSTPLTAELLKKQDLCVLLTNHKTFDYGFIAKHAPLILDTRNAFDKMDSPNVVRL